MQPTTPYGSLTTLHWLKVACNHLPKGILNVVTGSGNTGEDLVRHPDTRVIAFTGSVDTGKKIAVMAAKQLKKTSLELGGNDPIIICDDVDIEIAAKGTAWGGLLNAGQVCTSIERVFVMESIADSFIEAVVEEAKQVRLGDPSFNLLPRFASSFNTGVSAKISKTAFAAAMLTPFPPKVPAWVTLPLPMTSITSVFPPKAATGNPFPRLLA